MDEIVRIRVQGLVQGVGFRAFTLAEARRLGIVGWVRNLPDGDVELMARVNPATRQSLVSALHRGPPGARVDAVEVRPAQNELDFPAAPFHVKTN